MKENEAVEMSYCELGGGWVGGWEDVPCSQHSLDGG